MFESYHIGNDWSKRNAYALACLSKIAYLPKDEAEIKTEEMGATEFKWFENDDTQAFLCQIDGALILTYRGTESIGDWLTDLNMDKIEWPVGYCHSGFVEAFLDTWPKILSYIDDNDYSPLWITGHSLGGALATLSASEIILAGGQVEGLYTFGCPRVGDKEFCNFMDAKLGHMNRRFVNNNDVVPRIPQRLLGYSHCGHVMHFGEDGTLHEDGLSWTELLKDRLSGRIHDILSPGTDGIKDHSISKYKKLLGGIND